mmetsp:Transcript_120090/g.384605  ORF Transcript_120090/g.384605 Transcript_120090/m.384605 type:complete len:236 (-) Transcript_120090:60-767(-)
MGVASRLTLALVAAVALPGDAVEHLPKLHLRRHGHHNRNGLAMLGGGAGGGVHLLQHAAAAQKKAAAADADPIMLPLQPASGFADAYSEDWPYWVQDDPESQRIEKTCRKAFQTSFDCTFIPVVRGGPYKCDCPGPANEYGPGAVVNCHNFMGYSMTGSWMIRANRSDSVPADMTVLQTHNYCLAAFQQSYDCFDIPAYKGGAKGDCVVANCWTWYNKCMGGNSTGVPEHKHSVY